ncbi:MAG: DUF3168 domain-containing protein [Thermoleophilia bacterium]|nr:DUF3168 domain-containing protein [Thermoleophilia bacterium]
MPVISWPHAHAAHAIADFLKDVSACEDRVTTRLPRERVYPLAVVQPAGFGPLGSDAAIQADEPRLQVDVWAKTQEQALAIAAVVFRLLDARFGGALRFITLLTEDEGEPGFYYETKVERIARSGGGDAWFDEIAKKFRVTAFYNVKVNI